MTQWRPQEGARLKFVFGSPYSTGGSISGQALADLLPDGVTPHGFRATFRTWCEDHGVEESVAEHALAHGLKDSVAKAYRRGTALELRRKVMQDWADHLSGANI
jgi:integrase